MFPNRSRLPFSTSQAPRRPQARRTQARPQERNRVNRAITPQSAQPIMGVPLSVLYDHIRQRGEHIDGLARLWGGIHRAIPEIIFAASESFNQYNRQKSETLQEALNFLRDNNFRSVEARFFDGRKFNENPHVAKMTEFVRYLDAHIEMLNQQVTSQKNNLIGVIDFWGVQFNQFR